MHAFGICRAEEMKDFSYEARGEVNCHLLILREVWDVEE